jgi:GntR family transcriptional regulator, transcriptional repressor for pyruvate dehydrogenase complex
MADGRHAVSLIAPLAAPGRAEGVVLRVSQAIKLGLLGDGEQLPPEAEFAAQLGVSAMTLREALAVLRQQGLVETRRGRTGGTFVRRPIETALSVLRDRLLAVSVDELRDLADEQGAVSGAAARLAATRAPTSAVRRLFTLADQFATAVTPAEQVRADSRFHIEVALAAKSNRLTALEVALQAQLAELRWLPLNPAQAATAGNPVSADTDPAALLDHRTAAGEHATIAAAIEAEDGSRARRLVEQHIEANLRRLIELRKALTPHP